MTIEGRARREAIHQLEGLKNELSARRVSWRDVLASSGRLGKGNHAWHGKLVDFVTKRIPENLLDDVEFSVPAGPAMEEWRSNQGLSGALGRWRTRFDRSYEGGASRAKHAHKPTTLRGDHRWEKVATMGRRILRENTWRKNIDPVVILGINGALCMIESATVKPEKKFDALKYLMELDLRIRAAGNAQTEDAASKSTSELLDEMVGNKQTGGNGAAPTAVEPRPL